MTMLLVVRVRLRITIWLIGEAKRAGDIPAATAEDVDAAVKAAKEAFYRNKGSDWAKATGKHRATFLRAIAKRVSI